MAYSIQYTGFSSSKRSFFAKISSHNSLLSKIEEVNNFYKGNRDYSFLINYSGLIEKELNGLLTVLEQDKITKKNEDFWCFAYCCSLMLYHFYKKYGDTDKVKIYHKKRLELKSKLENAQIPEEKMLSPLMKIKKDIQKLVTEPIRISVIRDAIGFSNIHRIHYNFCRFAIKQTIFMANELQWIQKLDNVLGKKTDLDSVFSILNAPALVFNVLSVGLFASRFIINLGLMLKHIFYPTDGDKTLKHTQRLAKELYDRHCVMLNDFVWATVNLLTNYNALFHISGSVAGFLTAGFLLFDVALLVHRYHLAKKEFYIKEAQYLSEKLYYQKQSDESKSEEERKRYEYYVRVIDQQLIVLNIERKKTYAALQFNMAAAVFLMSGFLASLLIASPVAIAVLYFLCTVAIAMYLSAGEYANYKEKSFIYHQKQLKDTLAYNAMKEARNHFIFTMIKNTLMPLLIITTFAICWQAALVLTAVYIGYECLHGYWKKPAAAKPLAQEEVIDAVPVLN